MYVKPACLSCASLGVRRLLPFSTCRSHLKRAFLLIILGGAQVAKGVFKFDFLTAGPAVQPGLPTNNSCLSSHRHFLRAGPGLRIPEYLLLVKGSDVFSVGEITVRNAASRLRKLSPFIPTS